jgi:hypothetical protein
MSYALAMEVRHASQDLLEAALDFTWGHAASLDGRVKVSAGTEFHHFAPMLGLILNKINSLDNVDVVQCRRDTKFCGKFLDVFFFRFVLPSFPELLQIRQRGLGN